MAARLLLALVASTGVTASVAGPMAYQAHRAEVRAEQRQQDKDRERPTTSTLPPPNPNVLGETTIPLPGENTSVAPSTTAQPGG